MSKDKLVVSNEREGWVIGWWLAEDGDLGALLGESGTSVSLTGAVASDREWTASEIAAAALMPAPERCSMGNFVWESNAEATKALREIKARMVSMLADVPWPDWAVKAKAAGWNAPRGWKP